MNLPKLPATLSALILSACTLSAATYTKGYTIGNSSPLLLGNGSGAGQSLFVDQAGTGGNDLTADGGNPLWGWEIDAASSWTIGDSVSFTGLAMPFHASAGNGQTSSNTQDATHRIRIYSCGPNNDFDGTGAETLLGTRDVLFRSAGQGVAVYTVNFDTPVDWPSADSTKFYFYIQAINTNPGDVGTAMRVKSGATGALAQRVNRTNGVPFAAAPTTQRLSVAGTVTPLISPPSALEWIPGSGGDNVSVYQEANWIDSDTGTTPAAGAVNPNVDLDRTLIIRTGIPGGGGGAGGELQLGTGSLLVSHATLRMNATSGIDLGSTNQTFTINEAVVLTETITNANVEMLGHSNLTLFAANPLINTTIDLHTTDCFVFFPNRLPSVVINNDIGKFEVNGAPAVSGTNLSVSQHYNGSVVRSIPSGGVALKAFDGSDLTGTQWDFTTGFKGPQGLGFTTYDAGSYTLSGWGTDIGGTLDECHYTYLSLPGDGEIIARVDDLANATEEGAGGINDAKAGIMIRKFLFRGSANAFVFQNQDNTVDFQARTAGSQATTSAGPTGGTGTVKFLRLVRTGTDFTAFYSTTSTSGPWTQIGTPTSIPGLSGPVYIGLASVSGDGYERCTSKFSEVSATGAGAPGDLGLFTDTADIDAVWGQDNQISSFLLKRGYMVTVSSDAAGQGSSKVYVASEDDLVVNLADDGLDNDVSFMRVLPWRWLTKRGWAGSDGTMMTNISASWNYEWEPTGFSTNNRTFFPMIKGRSQDKEFRWEEVRTRGSQTNFLGFNEPESAGQGDLTVDEAIALWPRAQQNGLRLGSPARTDGAPGDTWLQDFMTQAAAKGYRVDYVCVHNYNRFTGAALQTWLEAEHAKYNLPIWLTEFQREINDNPSAADHETYLAQVIPMLEGLSFLEGYAYYNFDTTNGVNHTASLFGPGPGFTPNALGTIYGGSDSNPGYTNPAGDWATADLTVPGNLTQGTGGSFAANFSLGSPTISSVEFFSNGLSLGTDPSAPFTLSIDSFPAGFQTIHAVITTSFGETITTDASQLTIIDGSIPAPEFLANTPSSTGEISWTTVSGQTYRVEWSEDLETPVWNELTTVLADDITESVTDPSFGPNPTPRFYRVVLVE